MINEKNYIGWLYIVGEFTVTKQTELMEHPQKQGQTILEVSSEGVKNCLREQVKE